MLIDLFVRRTAEAIPTLILISVLVFGLFKMVPGFESVGYLKEAHHLPAYPPVKLAQIGGLSVYTIDGGNPLEEISHEGDSGHEAEGESSHGEETHTAAGEEPCHACEVVPFLRGSATDLNFTIALALIAVVMSQVVGVQALGVGYFE